VHYYEVLRRPMISEKSTRLLADNKYCFEVARRANRNQIKEAVEKSFGVSVVKVNVLTVHGKRRKRGTRMISNPSWRKAMVTLKSGDKIEIFEGV